MHLISSMLFAISANADNFVIGISYGLKRVHIPISINLAIGFVTFAGTLLSIHLGGHVGSLIPAETARVMGSGFLILLGLYYLMTPLIRKEPAQNQTAELHPSPPARLSRKEAIAISLALTLNNAGMGIGASISGISLIPTSLLSLFCSILFLFLGNKMGKSHLFCTLSHLAEPLSGLIIVILGIYELMI